MSICLSIGLRKEFTILLFELFPRGLFKVMHFLSFMWHYDYSFVEAS